MTCKNCGEEGHVIAECKNPRKIDRSHIPDVSPEAAWIELKIASDERDMDDMKEAIEKYVKGHPEVTYVDLETAFRTHNINCYIIATERELAITYVNMDLQGHLGKKYSVSFRKSDKPLRPKEKEGKPIQHLLPVYDETGSRDMLTPSNYRLARIPGGKS
jgi:hypothetical protein